MEPTPVTEVDMECRGRVVRVLLKRESHHPTGSVKDRTARGLLVSLDRTRALTPGTVVVESTSGNLGLGLARLLRRMDCRLIAVVDPRAPEATVEALRSMGAELCLVDEPDHHGGYLLSRLQKVRQLCLDNPGYRWTDQYNNPANPAIHRATTGPELFRGAPTAPDAVYVAVSTGGTLAGVAGHVRSVDRGIRIVAVDAEGSRSVDEHGGGERLIPGIGSSRRSAFLHPGSYDSVVKVGAAATVAMCRYIRQSTGLCLGGSSGAVVHAVLADQTGPGAPRRPLALCADGGEKYERTIYDDGWLERYGLADQVADRIDGYRAEGVVFSLPAESGEHHRGSDMHIRPPGRLPYGAPMQSRDDARAVVRRIWSEELFVEHVELYDDFFDLGGDSLTAVRVAFRVQEEFGLDVPVETLFMAPTVAEFIGALSSLKSTEHTEPFRSSGEAAR
ncbi:pyridoxal-phosphate dependent enzyme [Streptomyces tsukubensis]|uniref:pyridoxal-phosphate dependent enzyme n=1 Tax=Streptomyces tsukubensis TaxID=83656 RepID=UPI00367F81CB